MDIHYSDQCGEIIQRKAVGAARITQKTTTCGNCLQGARAEKRATETSLTLSEFDSDYFSSDTIARRKSKPASGGSQLTLVEDDDDTSPKDMAPIRSKEVSSGLALFDETLRLTGEINIGPSGQSMLEEAAKQHAPESSPAPQGASGAPTMTEAPPAGPQPTEQPVAVVGDRWQLGCIKCGTKLAVPPVAKKSRVRCPKCKMSLLILPTGFFLPESKPTPPPATSKMQSGNLEALFQGMGNAIESSMGLEGPPAAPDPNRTKTTLPDFPTEPLEPPAKQTGPATPAPSAAAPDEPRQPSAQVQSFDFGESSAAAPPQTTSSSQPSPPAASTPSYDPALTSAYQPNVGESDTEFDTSRIPTSFDRTESVANVTHDSVHLAETMVALAIFMVPGVVAAVMSKIHLSPLTDEILRTIGQGALGRARDLFGL